MKKYTQEEVNFIIWKARLEWFQEWCDYTAKCYETAFAEAKNMPV